MKKANIQVVLSLYGDYAQHLLFQEPTIAQNFTEDPNGEFDPDRLLAESKSDCFKVPNLQPAQFAPKILVITDPTLYTNQEIINELDDLVRLGFTIYAADQSGCLFPFNPSPQETFEPNLGFNAPDTLKQVIAKHPNTTTDQIALLDYWDTRMLIASKTPDQHHQKPSYPNINDFFDLTSGLQKIIAERERHLNKSSLRSVDVKSSNINIDAFKSLQKLFQIKSFSFSNPIDIKKLSALSLPALEDLDLGSNRLTGDELKQFLAQFQNLKYLNLHTCRLSSKHIQALMALNLPKLEHLDLGRNNLSGLTSDELKQFLAQFQNLKYLNLSYCSLSSKHIQALMALNLPKLEHLDLGSNDLSGLTSEELKQFLAQFQNLKYLNLSYCHLSLEHIQALMELNLPKLEHLDLYGNDLSGLTSDELKQFL
ncbi:MAG: hypothetical protein KKH85_11010, partial [Proteobacteria bacterium]|nr:hypothetical protein [Pseudomonadota bacterium]